MDPNATISHVIAISDWIANSYLRSIIIWFFIFGMIVGAAFSKYTFAFIRWYIERRDEKKKQEREQSDRLAREATAAKEAEANRKVLNDGIYWDRRGNAFCPACQAPLKPFRTYEHTRGYFSSCCPKCNAERYIYRDPVEIVAEVKAEFAK